MHTATSSTGSQSWHSHPPFSFLSSPWRSPARTGLPVISSSLAGSTFISTTQQPLTRPSGARYFTKDGLRGECLVGHRQTSGPGERGFRFLPCVPSRSLPLATLGATLLLSKPSCANSTPVLLARVRASWTSGLSRGGSSSYARPLVQIWVVLTWHTWIEEVDLSIDNGGVQDGGHGYRVSHALSCCLLRSENKNIYDITQQHHTRDSYPLRIPTPSAHAGVLLAHAVYACTRSPANTHIHATGCRRGVFLLLCQVAVDSVLRTKPARSLIPRPGGSTATPKLKGYYKEGFYVFGVVTTHDIEMLERESRTCRGPIACTTVVDSVALRLGYRLTSYAPGALCHRAPGPTLRPWAMNELYANSARRPIYRSHCAIRLERRTNSTCSSSNPTSF